MSHRNISKTVCQRDGGLVKMPLQPSTFSFALKPMPVATSFPDKSGLTFLFWRGSVLLTRRTIERPVMNATLLLNKAGKNVEHSKRQVAVDAKAAQLAHELARAAKVNLKQARKLSKMARKSARKAEARAEESAATLENARAKLELLRERIRNAQRKNNPTPKPKPARSDGDLARNRPKSTPAGSRATGPRRSAQKTVNGAPAKPVPAVAPEAKPVPATQPELDGPSPLPAPVGAATSFSGQEPADN
jgi:hypothetical protein